MKLTTAKLSNREPLKCCHTVTVLMRNSLELAMKATSNHRIRVVDGVHRALMTITAK